ncbi:prepilin-type N-terminal cleavage/methylation domain-containing protein [Desulfatitalea alkaliphila]|uniref:Prepilin-type N-terminal cleavage/methylation domain-containing protein n=1 Tax=Desulfatitalea alkaliphila TaxID=2929485 RepID=A0AA41UJH2_9BACT|nr:prepilin-type N-terminal cleavage/methylation domain-containing protein [Desulfatitalea alkaliphila]MCJ8501930.1 prepilin-type N-terminal cleavage/methylation domain-containing protein [Desulfatitalea alkaliphila]
MMMDIRGVTLIEIMIALFVFTVGVLAVASMQGVGMAGIAKARLGHAYSLAAGAHIEKLLSMPFDDPLLVDEDDGFHPETPDHGPFSVADGNGRLAWEIADDEPIPGGKRIRVMVTAQGRGGAPLVFTYDYVKVRE